jgi:Na+-driven multidrug efflux pump
MNDWDTRNATTTTSSSSSNDGSSNSSIGNNEKRTKRRSLSHRTAEIAVPALIAMLADPVLSLMDTAFIGRIGATELAALGACTSIFSLFFNAFRATTQATTSLVASAPDESTRRRIIAISLRFGLITGTIVMTILFLIGSHLLHFMGVSRDSAMYRPACDYLFTRLWAAPAVLYIGVAEGIFRGSADTMTPLRASWVAALLNLILDPFLMFGLGWQVKGAAAATAVAQLGAAATYAITLRRRKWLQPLLPTRITTTTTATERISSDNDNHDANKSSSPSSSSSPQSSVSVTSKVVVQSILAANAAMLWKQGSLLLAWSYATSRATRLGAGAAHQIGLSVWLIFAFILDAPAVAAQVLRSKINNSDHPEECHQLQRYFWQLAIGVGVVAMIGLRLLDYIVPQFFSSDIIVRENLRQLMPHLAWSQVLVSLTLVTEGLAAGANQFRTLALGTTLATLLSVYITTRQTSIAGIWAYGISSLFVGRFITACIAISTTKNNNNNQQRRRRRR